MRVKEREGGRWKELERDKEIGKALHKLPLDPWSLANPNSKERYQMPLNDLSICDY